MALSDDMDRIQTKADDAHAALEQRRASVEGNELLSAQGKRETMQEAERRYQAQVAELREAAQANIEIERRRLPRLRQAARSADEAASRELLGDALAAQLYIKRISEMDGEQALVEFEAATPWQRALFGFRPTGQTGGDVTLQERMAQGRAPEWVEAEALELAIEQAQNRVERLDVLGQGARLRALYNIR